MDKAVAQVAMSFQLGTQRRMLCIVIPSIP